MPWYYNLQPSFCWQYICQQNGSAKVPQLIKLYFAFSILVQPIEQMEQSEAFFLTLSQHKPCAKQFLWEIAEQKLVSCVVWK